MKRDTTLFLEDILENINNIESFSKGISKQQFKKNKLKQNAIIRCLEVIGEAVKSLPKEFLSKYPKVPWSEIAGFRDVMIHAYFVVDIERVWKVVEEDMPELKKNIIEIIEKERPRTRTA